MSGEQKEDSGHVEQEAKPKLDTGEFVPFEFMAGLLKLLSPAEKQIGAWVN